MSNFTSDSVLFAFVDTTKPDSDSIDKSKQKEQARLKNVKNGSILDYMKERRIFSVTSGEDGVYITESCDDYFSVEMSKDDIGRLIGELSAIHDLMEKYP